MRTLFFFLLLLPSLLVANDRMIAQGNTYFDTGQYEKARDIYKKALKKETEEWKKPFILFNIGNVYLQQKRWNHALEIYNTILSAKNVSPYLIPRVHINVAVALLGQSEVILQQEKDPFYISPSRLSNPITLLQAAKTSIKKAESDYCEIYKFEDFDTCPSFNIINEIQQALLERTAYIGLLEVQYRLSTIPFKEGVQILREYVISMIHQLKQWEPISNIASDSVNVGLGFKNIDPLWQALKRRLDELEPHYQTIFRESRRSFRHAITDIQKQQIDLGIDGLENSQKDLNQLLGLLPDPHPILTELSNGVNKLTNLLVFGKITNKSLQVIKTSVQEIEKNSKKASIAENETSDAFQRVKRAIEEFSWGNIKNARLYLIAAGQSLEQGIIAYHLQTKDDPIEYLKAAIESQQDALDLSIEIQGLADPTPEIIELLNQSQNRSHQAGKLFVDKVFAWQEQNYHELSSEEVCQKKPWNHVMPFFHQGFQKSSEIEAILAVPPPILLGQTVSLQKKVLKFWKATLHTLEEDSSTVQEETETDEPQQDDEPEVDLSSRNINQILKTIIELDQQDRTTPPQFFRKPQDIQRPW